MSLKQLIEHLERKHDAKVHRLFPAGDDKLCLYDHTQKDKLEWSIDIGECGKVVVEPEGPVYSAWPQLRMAVQMLGKVPEGPARNNFINQARAAAKSLQAVKDSFSMRFNGPVSSAYVGVARPPDSDVEKRQYFDAVLRSRQYIALQAHVVNSKGEDAELPLIRYNCDTKTC